VFGKVLVLNWRGTHLQSTANSQSQSLHQQGQKIVTTTKVQRLDLQQVFEEDLSQRE
jgi:hypothetical protein